MPESEKTCSEHLSPPHSDRGHESEGSSRTEEGVGEVAVLDSISDSEKLLEEQEHRKEKYDLKDDEDGISYSNLLLNDEESDKQELLERSSDESDANGDDVESKNDKTKWFDCTPCFLSSLLCCTVVIDSDTLFRLTPCLIDLCTNA
jgi:hypothetical protein